ncbi:MAG: DUF4314 domain-containing protein [Oscillibacter sp.]|nr:DUF4314 domain-containing protein [Oscillibacter sp.]
MELPEEWLNFLREQFPEGSRIQLRQSADVACPVQSGSKGVLTGIDNSGQFHVTWEGGQVSNLTAADKFRFLPPEPETLKFYMPLTGEVFEPDEYGDMEEEPFYLNGENLLRYEDQIVAQMVRERMPEEGERGLMHWYDQPDGVADKVQSAVFTAESRDGKLWGVAECRVVGKLSLLEMEALKDYLLGQASDGAGESLEQHEIKVENGELYVHLWDSSDNWTIETEAERFGPKIAKGLPPMCFSVLESTGELIGIERGESGYYTSELDTGDMAQNEAIADRENAKLGVTPEQRMAMEIGSLCGWNVPGADPKTYEGKLSRKEPPSPQKAEGAKKRREPSR